MKIYFTLNEHGYLEGYSSSSRTLEHEYSIYGEDDPEYSIEVADDHEVLQNPLIYRYVDGEFIRDSDYQLEQLKIDRFKELSKQCEQDILGYFEGTVNSVSYLFSFDYEAQNNFTASLALFTRGIVSEMEWTVHEVQSDGETISDERIMLDEGQFLQVISTAFQHKNLKISRLRNEIQVSLDEAKTFEEVESIKWKAPI